MFIKHVKNDFFLLLQAHNRLAAPLVSCQNEFPVPAAVKLLMSQPMDVITFNFFDPTDLLIRLLALGPLGARAENMAFFPSYALVAAPLHHLTRKAVVYPKPWIPGQLIISLFWRLKSMMLDQPLLLWNKLSSKRLL